VAGLQVLQASIFETWESISRYNLSMNRSAQEILEDASQLPPAEVNWLIENLLQEGASESEAEIEAAWDGEIKRRLDEIDTGAVELIPGEQVRAEMIATLSPQARTRLRV
jgi:putative addiction module component (TIGR02574 family)